MITEAPFHAIQYQVTNIITAVVFRTGDLTDGFAITAVQREITLNLASSSQRNSKPFEHQVVSLVHGNTASVPTRHAGLFDPV